MTRLGIIGCGNMAEALLSGIIKAKLLQPVQMLVSDVRDEPLEQVAARYKVKTTRNNMEVVRECETIVLLVKPQQVKEVLDEVGDELGDHHLVISLAAGIPIRAIEGRMSRTVPVIRVMPNMPALVQETAAGIALGSHASASHRDQAVKMFNAIGEALVVTEDQMDAVTALSGSGPAYVFYLVEAMIKAGIAEGLAEEDARALAVQTAYGAARMLTLTMEDPADLRRKVTSSGGTTEAAIRTLEEKGWESILKEAVHAARVRAEEIAEMG